jgi:hypothetical protein
MSAPAPFVYSKFQRSICAWTGRPDLWGFHYLAITPGDAAELASDLSREALAADTAGEPERGRLVANNCLALLGCIREAKAHSRETA